MKNSIIAILIGAILIMAYQTLSWMMLPIHASSHKYTPMEDSLIQSMSGLETGVYFLPGEEPGASKEEIMAKREASIGKPWAILSYHEKMEMNMAKSVGLGLLINIIIAWLVVYLIQSGNITGKNNILRTTMLIGFITIFTTTIMEWNWFSTPMHNMTGDILDQIIISLILGLWLGYYFSRKPKVN